MDTCVCCGEIVPEGRMVCWGCEMGYKKKGRHNGNEVERDHQRKRDDGY